MIQFCLSQENHLALSNYINQSKHYLRKIARGGHHHVKYFFLRDILKLLFNNIFLFIHPDIFL